ncbi:PLD nuclease N-terminal domain-containing protein [Nocardioides sediminis]|uniref:PLD nuclease N-terminal domain-containing protein n=1 Tax=Nocardioides sediminis TaxID=433648 RepID=UPI000D31968A|nr:PLD nuclease N-terminal domain-containing protein [Nocardioides sediminis]
MASKKWSELSSSQKRAITVVGAVEAIMTLAAWRDLARRPDDGVRGPKWAWAGAVLVQPFGPPAYFTLGRR